MEAGAFGAGKAGTTFNPVEFVQRPQVILRLLNIVSIVSIHNSAMFPSQCNNTHCRRCLVFTVCVRPLDSFLFASNILILVKPFFCNTICIHSSLFVLFTLQLFSIIVFGSISSKGYRFDGKKEVCLYNNDGNACNYGVGIGISHFPFLISDLKC